MSGCRYTEKGQRQGYHRTKSRKKAQIRLYLVVFWHILGMFSAHFGRVLQLIRGKLGRLRPRGFAPRAGTVSVGAGSRSCQIVLSCPLAVGVRGFWTVDSDQWSEKRWLGFVVSEVRKSGPGPPAYSELLWSGLYPNRSGLWYSALMPTVLRLGSLRIVIYPNDHWPAHVHVIGQGNSAIFNLNCPAGPLNLRVNFGFSDHQLHDIQAKLLDHITELCRAWEEIHG